ncbi:hypothetical protein B296_00055652 [Ensete ventricosum]|uniref:Uncharacterized protein n=1 Tax=Ensete ventricosum TaxID=4639 RepID=A0A426WYD1_ENSVE|nr:hypothetical protein B296_00055652 [Ensete ventricosum]
MIWVHTRPTRVNIGERRAPYLPFTPLPPTSPGTWVGLTCRVVAAVVEPHVSRKAPEDVGTKTYNTAYYLLRSMVEHSYISPKSLAFGYLDEKPIDTGLMKFLGHYPSALSWYLEFVSAFSTSSTPFTTNALPPWEQGIDDSTEVPLLRYHGVTKLIAPLSIALHLHPFLHNQ